MRAKQPDGSHPGKLPPRILRALLTAAGSVSLGLGVLGVFVPLLPTTPFLLLAAACYVRGSPRLSRWLLYHPWLGRYIRDYRDGRVIPLRAKIMALSLLWITVGSSVLFLLSILWVRLLLLAVATAVSIHLLTIKTRRESAEPCPPTDDM